MKLKEGFILRQIADQNIIVPIGDNIQDFNGIINMNESACFLLNLLKNDITIDKLVSSLCNEYDIDENLAKKDVDEFLNVLKEHNMLECD